VASAFPSIDEAVRRRLIARFGPQIEAWFEHLPHALGVLAQRWPISFGASIPRGSMSVVVRCHLRDGRSAVLKVSPDRARVAYEAAALDRWTTEHTPSVLAHDDGVGALLIEGIEPGTALLESRTYPAVDDVSELLTSLHRDAAPHPTYPAVARHVAYLFDATAKLYERHAQFAEVVSQELYERGRRLATALAADPPQTVLLHGDLTPSNILDGGPERGLVAIDPAPCLGDSAFDAVDLVLWQAAGDRGGRNPPIRLVHGVRGDDCVGAGAIGRHVLRPSPGRPDARKQSAGVGESPNARR
jgi:streptomycin 6-kinase